MKEPALVLIIFLLTGPLAGQQPSKSGFWDTQRRGANCFNMVPTEKWFKDASEAGLQWVRFTFSKWEGEKRDFLIGNTDRYTGLVEADLVQLEKAIGWADKYGVKIVLTPLSLPGSRYRQHNGNKYDDKLWQSYEYHKQAEQFWRDLAGRVKDHKAVVGYNIINEPAPELTTGMKENGGNKNYYSRWYESHKGTPRDLPAFYQEIINAIREVDSLTPIMLDAGWYGQPMSFTYWPEMQGSHILYSIHMYEPWAYTNRRNFVNGNNLIYPGEIPSGQEIIHWDKNILEGYLQPFLEWAASTGIPESRLVIGEFGCYRRNSGCARYLGDLIEIFNTHNLHWAFYSFREDEWDGYDYEIGDGPLGWKYWEAKEQGKTVEPERSGDNPMWKVIKEGLK